LRELVGEAEGFSAEAYTQDSYGPYLAAVSAGKAVLDNASATQADVNAACTSIVAAREALEPAPSTPDPSDPQTEMDGWHCDASGTWYYLRDGKRVVGWMYDEGTKEWYHFSDDGSMEVGWISWQGRWYYLSRKHDGRYGKLSVGWFFDGSDWYFGQQEHDGHYGAIRVGWIYDGSGWYFGNQEHDGRYGAILAGWIEDGGKRYYLSELHDGSYGRWIA
jgi:glucan-binding YG repeat protein